MEKNFKLYMAQSGHSVQFNEETHQKVLKKWKNNNLYTSVNKNLNQTNVKPFVFVDGPPYANGGAHLGHVLNKVWKDLTVKSQWYLGKEVQWTPGWDCHGLPLELQVDKKHPLENEVKKKDYCKQLALRSLVKQRDDFVNLGVHADWEKPYLTLSMEMKQKSWSTLASMVNQDLLEYKLWPVHHCPVCASSLAEAELEYEAKDRLELYFKYKLSNNEHALVWTTTPWTLPMNQGLAYNENFSYDKWVSELDTLYVDENANDFVVMMLEEKGYTKSNKVNGSFFKELSGQTPLLKNNSLVLHGDFVTSGETGFVHLAGSHGVEDYNLLMMHDVQPFNLLDKNGKYLENKQLNSSFWGQKNSAVDNLVVQELGELLLSSKKTKVDVAHCWRHKVKTYYQATWQVFLKLEQLKPRVQKLLEESNLQNHLKENLKNMLLSRPHWCLSRQRYWGTELNVLVNKNTKELDSSSEYYLNCLSENKTVEAQEFLANNTNLEVVKDVLDVWFDSGNVAFALGEYNGFDSADMVLEGKDQYRGWFQSLLWLSAVHNKLPYKNLLVHGFVLDETKQKFSKSSKNGVSAKEALKLYGADVLRLWATMQEHETDAVFSKVKMEESKKYYQRLRLTLRFLNANAHAKNRAYQESKLEEYQHDNDFDFHRYSMMKLEQLKLEFSDLLKVFEYKKALQALYAFTDKFLSQFVFEVMKSTLYLKSEETKEKQMMQVLVNHLLVDVLKMVSVFAPFLAEEFMLNESESVFLLESNKNYNFTNNANWDLVLDLKREMFVKMEPLQQQKLMKGNNQVYVEWTLPEKMFEEYNQLVNSMSYQNWLGVSVSVAVKGQDFNLDLYNLDKKEDYSKCPRCWFYFKEKALDQLCDSCSND